ncbi:MAG: glycosyltransferase family 4 protein, partial [candidate division Zixibacteria bacterium]|nr:glycosyltransferase family 4 protein [candidate division Zixibacteria bacterium]
MQEKTLIIGPLPPPYHGVAVMVKWLIEGLRKRNGFDFIHLNTQDPKKSKNFGKFTLRNSWFALKNIFRLFKCLMKEKIEVVYIPISQEFWCFLRDSIFVLIARLLFRKRIVVHLHGGYFKIFYHQNSRLVKKYINFVFKYVSRGIVLGHCLKSLLEDVLPQDKIDVVYNGIDTSPFEKTNITKSKNGKFRLLFAGVLDESKGFFDLIKAIPTVTRYYPDIEVSIAGRWEDDRLKNQVTTYIRDNELQDKVRFVGVVTGEEKRKLFKNSDTFVLPTYFYLEGQPVVILEAMAAGLPV